MKLLQKSEKPLFFVDAMLGNIAKKLRILGYDSVYSSSIDDFKLIREASKNRWIIVTKDEQLANLAKQKIQSCVLITSNNEIEQMLQIFKKLGLKKAIIDASTSRCPLCNGTLVKIEKDLICKKIPKGIFNKIEDFWFCSNCKKIYWHGSHIDNLQEFVLSLNERL